MGGSLTPNTLEVKQVITGDLITLSPTGDLDLLTAPALRSAIEAARGAGRRLVINLSGLGFGDSTLIHVLLEAAEVAHESGCTLTVEKEPESILRLFALAEINESAPFRGTGRPQAAKINAR